MNLRHLHAKLKPENQYEMPARLGDYNQHVETGLRGKLFARLVSGEVVKIDNDLGVPALYDLRVTIRKDGDKWRITEVFDHSFQSLYKTRLDKDIEDFTTAYNKALGKGSYIKCRYCDQYTERCNPCGFCGAPPE